MRVEGQKLIRIFPKDASDYSEYYSDYVWVSKRGVAWVDLDFTGYQPTYAAHILEGKLEQPEDGWMVRGESYDAHILDRDEFLDFKSPPLKDAIRYASDIIRDFEGDFLGDAD